jgi:hypothetical protein
MNTNDFWIKDYINLCEISSLPSAKEKSFNQFKRDSVSDAIMNEYNVITFWQLRDKLSHTAFVNVLKNL